MKKSRQDAVFFLILLVWPIALMLAVLVGTRLWCLAQRPLIRHQVLENLPAMTALAEETLIGTEGAVWTRDVKIPESADSVWYESYAWGIVPSSQQYGYCYTADGTPRPYPGMEDYEEITDMFGFRWREPHGDNGCYLRHIAGSFYYYEVWF